MCEGDRQREVKKVEASQQKTCLTVNIFSLGTSGHKLTIDPFDCFKLCIPSCQLLIKQMQGKAPSAFSFDQSDALTVNICRNTVSKMEIFEDILKVKMTTL